MQVYVNLLNARNNKPAVSEGWPEGGIIIFLWPLRWNPDFLSRCKTPTCIQVNALLPSGWFPVYRMLFGLKAVFHAIPLTT